MCTLPDHRASVPSVGSPQTLRHVPLPLVRGILFDKTHASQSTADPAGSGRLWSLGISGTFVITAADGKWSGRGDGPLQSEGPPGKAAAGDLSLQARGSRACWRGHGTIFLQSRLAGVAGARKGGLGGL